MAQEDVLQSLLSRYSSLYKLQTSVAWLLRFKDQLRTRINKLPTEKYAKGYLIVKEFASATKEVVKVIQREAFPKERVILQRIAREPTRSSSDRKFLRGRLNCIGYASPLRKLSPLLHDGVICVGGRLTDVEVCNGTSILLWLAMLGGVWERMIRSIRKILRLLG